MTLDEAIKHCKEKAEELRLEAEQIRDIGEVVSNPNQPYNEPVRECRECANEHEQLAEWLEDYKRLLGEKSYAMGYQDGLEDGLQDIREQGDLISREYVEGIVEELENICQNAPEEVLALLSKVKNAPTVEYPFYQEAYQTGYEEGKNERPQGKWIIEHDWVHCFPCGHEQNYPSNYCPNCGADMRKGDET